jgi:hypothetical protein
MKLRDMELGFDYESEKLQKEIKGYAMKRQKNQLPKEVEITPQFDGAINP